MPPRISAERVLAASPAAVFSFLADMENHWLLADRFVEVLTLERAATGRPAHGGTVRMRAPLGLGRTARTRVVHAEPHTSIAGTAEVGAGTQAQVRWTLVPVHEGTRVRLEAIVERLGRFDALLLAVGGTRWLQRRFASILDTLARRVPALAQEPSA